MHELSVMTQVAESVRDSLAGRDVLRVESVRLEIGELTMLGREQVLFAWGVLTQKGPLKGAKLVVVRKPAVVKCPECGFRGAPKKTSKAWSHTAIPLISCPKCGGNVEIVGGRETIVRSLKAVVEEGSKGGRVKGCKGAREQGRPRASARGASVARRRSPGLEPGGFRRRAR